MGTLVTVVTRDIVGTLVTVVTRDIVGTSVTVVTETLPVVVTIDERANIHLGGQTKFCPNGAHKLFVPRHGQGEKIIIN